MNILAKQESEGNKQQQQTKLGTKNMTNTKRRPTKRTYDYEQTLETYSNY